MFTVDVKQQQQQHSLNLVVYMAGDSLWSFSLKFNQFRHVSQPLVGLPSCLSVQGFLVVSVHLGVGQDVSKLLTNTCTFTSANWST